MSIREIFCNIRLFLSKGLLSAYMDNQLGEKDKRKAERFIEQCPGAQVYCRDIQRLDRFIKAAPEHEVPGLLKQKIDNTIINQGSSIIEEGLELKPARSWGRRLFMTSSILAGICITAIISVMYMHSDRVHSQTAMLASMDMYQHIKLYEHMELIEHMDEIMAVNVPENSEGTK